MIMHVYNFFQTKWAMIAPPPCKVNRFLEEGVKLVLSQKGEH